MIGIIDYGMGNLRSVQKGFEAIGEKTFISSSILELKKADKLILPGVGSFGKGMEELKKRNLIDFLIEEKERGKFILGICLGMQFLLSKSYEEGEFSGLNFISGEVRKFESGKSTHMGWNQLHNLKTPLFNGINEGDDFYFVHSYFADTSLNNAIATTDYNGEFVSAINDKNIFGVQFHPEKSGESGLKLLKNYANL